MKLFQLIKVLMVAGALSAFVLPQLAQARGVMGVTIEELRGSMAGDSDKSGVTIEVLHHIAEGADDRVYFYQCVAEDGYCYAIGDAKGYSRLDMLIMEGVLNPNMFVEAGIYGGKVLGGAVAGAVPCGFIAAKLTAGAGLAGIAPFAAALVVCGATGAISTAVWQWSYVGDALWERKVANLSGELARNPESVTLKGSDLEMLAELLGLLDEANALKE